jgi:uncharacterized protein (TIGR02246 family)
VGDSEAIAAVIAGLERGFNANDPELVVSGFAADAVVVDARGGVVAGREALLEAERAAVRPDQHARYAVEDVMFVRPDVAVARVVARAVSAAGEPIDVGHTMVSLYVLASSAGRWEVVARQSTLAAA